MQKREEALESAAKCRTGVAKRRRGVAGIFLRGGESGYSLSGYSWNHEETPVWFETVRKHTVAVTFTRLLMSPYGIPVLY